MTTLDDVASVVDQLARALPPTAAVVTRESTEDGAAILLSPKGEHSADVRIDIMAGNPHVFISAGHGGIFEVPPEGHRYSDLDLLDEIRAICLAVIRGEFRETVWFKGDEVVGGHGVVRIGSSDVGDRWRKVFSNPFTRTVRRSYSYAPYA